MTDKAIYQFLLSADGLNQLERSPGQLDPSTVSIDGRSKADILRFLHALSEQVRFYDLENRSRGDWRSFLELPGANGFIPEDAELEDLLASRDDWPPHIALLMA